MRNADHKNKILKNIQRAGICTERLDNSIDYWPIPFGSSVKRLSRIAVVLPLIVLGFAGCRQTANSPSGFASTVSVNPSSITVAAGSTSRFIAAFIPSLPEGGTVTWSVNPVNGGTITSDGVYTASATAGNYTVVATWTPSTPSAGFTMSSTATVEVLPVPQLGAALNTDLIDASGTIQVSGPIQNTGIGGQLVPSVTSIDPSGNVQTRSGFTIPAVCTGSDTSCP
jgi:hypothetical protein